MNVREYYAGLRERVKHQKTPLVLAVVAQASTIATWMAKEGRTGFELINLVIAIIAAFSIDLIIVSTAFGPKRSSAAWILSLATSVIALAFSSAIAIYLFNDTADGFNRWSLLHTAFPFMVFFYSWYLSISKHDLELLEYEERQRVKQEALERIPETIEAYRVVLIRKLLLRGAGATQIYDLIGGNKQRVLETVKTLQQELELSDTTAGT